MVLKKYYLYNLYMSCLSFNSAFENCNAVKMKMTLDHELCLFVSTWNYTSGEHLSVAVLLVQLFEVQATLLAPSPPL
jgi:hypothetical protein